LVVFLSDIGTLDMIALNPGDQLHLGDFGHGFVGLVTK
jgi:hypothetical protein